MFQPLPWCTRKKLGVDQPIELFLYVFVYISHSDAVSRIFQFPPDDERMLRKTIDPRSDFLSRNRDSLASILTAQIEFIASADDGLFLNECNSSEQLNQGIFQVIGRDQTGKL